MNPEVIVVGGINIDIGGQAFAPLVMNDSNPGKVSVSLGGVGRNIAHNLCLLGVKAGMLTALGEDLYARRAEDACGEAGIDLSRALRVPGGTTSTYIYLDGPDGDMAVALSDMEICSRITPDYLADHLELLNASRAVVVDTNIPEESLRWITTHCSVPIFADPVSTAKAGKLRPVLSRIHTLKPNRLEAELLSGVAITDDVSLFRAARSLLDTGMKRCVITLGSRGMLAADEHVIEIIPCCEAHMRNATGAGDAFIAALVWSFLEGTHFTEGCRMAAAAAAIAVESEETVSPDISAAAVRARAGR